MKQNLVRKLMLTKAELDKIIKRTKKRMDNAPPGSLNVYLKRGKPRYYWNMVEDGKRKKHYLGTNEGFKVSCLAQKDFDLKVLKVAGQQKECIEQFLGKYDEDALKNLYRNLSPERKRLVNDDILDDEEYAKRWAEVKYEPGSFMPGARSFITMRGEKVRSKSEKIIADTLYVNGIPYRYEYPLHLENGQTWRPDFLILDKRTRREYILEHFGMMDDPEYCAQAIGKMQIYMENGYFPGENLLITAESSACPLSTDALEMLLNHYLINN